MIDAFPITKLRAALSDIESKGATAVSFVPMGRNVGFADLSKSPVLFVAVASLDMPVHPDNEPE